MIKRHLALAIFFVGTILGMVVTCGPAWAEKRVALVVGNSRYQTVPQLPNSSRDADAVAKMFKDAGFDTVDLVLDVGNLDFKRAIRKFELAADQADIAVLYYAGHGLEIGGTNYLIPTDARLASDRDAEDEAITLERMITSADGAKKLRIIILDACRDNPFTTSMRRERRAANRAIASGLGKIEPSSTDTLIAYAAKAGSTAEDGVGDHSPFTTAILKNLAVPGLDIRLAFGRVRDEVMKSTKNKQEPFVYGSLGGGNISLVPAPTVAAEPSANDVKTDFELVAKINSRRAWEVFLGNYKSGFYSDLARAQLASLSDQLPRPREPETISPGSIAPGREQHSKEMLDWDKVKDSTDQSALQNFIRRYPNSPHANDAQSRLDVLRKAMQEREERARAEKEAARRAAEEAKAAAEQQKAEVAAAKKRAEEDRRAKADEIAQRARAAEAERKAAEAKAKAELAESTKAAKEASALRAASERQAREADEARRKAEQTTANEESCKSEQARFEEVNGKGSEGMQELTAMTKTLTCDRIKPLVLATISRLEAEEAKRAARTPNSPQLIASAKEELARLGCLSGKQDGSMTPATKIALQKFASTKGELSTEVSVTEELVSELNKKTGRLCPLECKANETAKGDICVAKVDPAKPVASRRNNKEEEDDDRPARRKPVKRQAEREAPRQQPKSAARQQAASRPSGGGHTMIGVGF